MHPEDVEAVCSDITDTIYDADVDGHINKLEEDGSGPQYAEALLQGLKPGMKPIMVEAFFPTFIWEITCKNIISFKGKRPFR